MIGETTGVFGERYYMDGQHDPRPVLYRFDASGTAGRMIRIIEAEQLRQWRQVVKDQLFRMGGGPMSRTEYSRTLMLRIDEPERHTLYLSVMQRIEVISQSELPAGEPGADEVRAEIRRQMELRRLRSLLERLEVLR